MVGYTVYPFKSSGVAPAFAFVEREDDSSAAIEAMNILRAHPSATRVTLFREDQAIFRGLSSACAAWLAEGSHRAINCPALSCSDDACPPRCRK
jgi:hypothetical protein